MIFCLNIIRKCTNVKKIIVLTVILMAAIHFMNDASHMKEHVKIISLQNSMILGNLEYWRKVVCEKQNSILKHNIENMNKIIEQAKSPLRCLNYKNMNQSLYEDSENRRRLPKSIIIGAMKCGTLALRSMIEMYSKIITFENEPQFFDWKYECGLDWYISKMPLSYSNQITLEKSPSYFRNALAPARIYKLNPSMRLILIVKDPITRSLSEYAHHKEHKRCPVSFQDLVIRPDGEVEANQPILMQSMYAHFLQNYLDVFPREQILVLSGEQLVTDPLPVIKKVERFLNLEPEITEENIYFDKEKGYFCMNHNGTIDCLPDDKGREHPEVDEHVLKKLRIFFAPYNQRFYDLVGEDFGWPEA